MYLTGLLGSVAFGSLMLSADGDPARHMAVGEYMLASGRIVSADVFSHTMAGHPFVPYEWLEEVASAAAYRAAGPAGPILLHGVALGLTFAILFGHMSARGQAPLLALAMTLLALAAARVHWLARPHIFTFLGTAIFAVVLDRWHTGAVGPRALWALPVAMLLWANLHPGFMVGLVLVAIYAGADVVRWLNGDTQVRAQALNRLRALALPSVAMVAATFATPVGGGLVGQVTSFFGKSLIISRTNDYFSPNFHSIAFLPFLLMLVGGAAVIAWSRRRLPLHEGLLFAAFGAFALYAGRSVPLFAIVAAPVLATQLGALPRPAGSLQQLAAAIEAWLTRRNAAIQAMEPHLARHLWSAAGTVVLIAVAVAQWRGADPPLGVAFDPRRQPVQAVAYLKANPPSGNVFNQLEWGGYLLWELWPGQRVFIDGITDFYGEGLSADYLRVVELQRGWSDVLTRHQVSWVLYETDSPLVRQLAATAGWRIAYEDPVASVLVRGP